MTAHRSADRRPAGNPSEAEGPVPLISEASNHQELFRLREQATWLGGEAQVLGSYRPPRSLMPWKAETWGLICRIAASFALGVVAGAVPVALRWRRPSSQRASP
jgi:hypothetical protein